MRMKARLCTHGSRDRESDKIRNDSSNAQFDFIRLLLSIASILSLRLGGIDIKFAYIQSRPITRKLHVRPPREWYDPQGVI